MADEEEARGKIEEDGHFRFVALLGLAYFPGQVVSVAADSEVANDVLVGLLQLLDGEPGLSGLSANSSALASVSSVALPACSSGSMDLAAGSWPTADLACVAGWRAHRPLAIVAVGQ